MSIEARGSDLRQWIRGGTCIIDNAPNAIAHNISVSESGRMEAQCYRLNSEGKVEAFAHNVSANNLTLWWPLIRCVSIKRSGFEFGLNSYRVGARQWRRTYHPEFAHVEIIRDYDVAYESGERVSHVSATDADYVLALKNYEYLPCDEAMARMQANDKCLSLAVNDNTVLYYDVNGRFLVYYRGEYVADIDARTHYLSCFKEGTIEKRLSKALGVPLA